jgi:hypothetical protein
LSALVSDSVIRYTVYILISQALFCIKLSVYDA